MQRSILFSTLFAVLISLGVYGQSSRYGKNIPRFEYRKWHFGCHLGGTSTSFHYKLKDNYTGPDSVKSITLKSRPGMAFQLPMVSYNPSYTVNFRFHPSLTFHETVFDYFYVNHDKLKNRSYDWRATNLNFPLQIKLNSKRLNNFGAYAVGGVGYSRNLTNQSKVQQSPTNPIVKTKPDDFNFNVGGGFDFFMPYFKFGIEVKMVSGFKNVLIQDNTFYSAPLESLRTYSWWVSLTFEG